MNRFTNARNLLKKTYNYCTLTKNGKIKYIFPKNDNIQNLKINTLKSKIINLEKINNQLIKEVVKLKNDISTTSFFIYGISFTCSAILLHVIKN